MNKWPSPLFTDDHLQRHVYVYELISFLYNRSNLSMIWKLFQWVKQIFKLISYLKKTKTNSDFWCCCGCKRDRINESLSQLRAELVRSLNESWQRWWFLETKPSSVLWTESSKRIKPKTIHLLLLLSWNINAPATYIYVRKSPFSKHVSE